MTDKRKCPKDAYNTYQMSKLCGEIYEPQGYFCTRKKGHKGLHHAHTKTGCLGVWK